MPLSIKNVQSLLVCSMISLTGFAQEKYFEGRVIYVTKELNERGEPVSSPVDKEEVYISKNVILTKPVSGMQPMMFGRTDVYLNAEKKLRYSVNHSNGTIKNLGVPSTIEKIIPLEEKKIGEEEWNGYPCEVNFLKYVHQYENGSGVVNDTLSCTYSIAKKLKIANAGVFGYLQGNRNTLLLDGRYEGVPLKVKLKRTNGAVILIESSEVKQMNVDKFTQLPAYPMEENK